MIYLISQTKLFHASFIKLQILTEKKLYIFNDVTKNSLHHEFKNLAKKSWWNYEIAALNGSKNVRTTAVFIKTICIKMFYFQSSSLSNRTWNSIKCNWSVCNSIESWNQLKKKLKLLLVQRWTVWKIESKQPKKIIS